MKTKFTLLVFFVAAFFAASAQVIPNNSFDNWSSPLAPDNWSSYDAIFGVNIGHCMKDSVDKVYGPASVKVVSDSINGFPSYGVLAGSVALGAGMANPNPVFPGVAFAFKPDTIYLLYKYTSPGTDTARMDVRMTNMGTGIFTGGATTVSLPLDTSSQWAFVYSIITSFYVGATLPDTLGLRFYSSRNPAPGGGVKGSTLHVDGVSFGYHILPSALQEVADKLNINVYPNPATDMITISTDENTEGFHTYICDITGKIVSANNLESQKTTINVSEFTNGTYIYRIADAQGNILKQNRFNVVK